MKEQVKEWIVDKNLTTDSFDSILIGVIYNSGHSTLDDPDVRKWIETHPGEFRKMLPLKLTGDQQVVLEWFKNEKKTQPFATVADFFTAYFEGTEEVPLNTMVSFEQLSTAEQFQVLAAFAEWGLNQLDDD